MHHTAPKYRELGLFLMSEQWRGSGGWGYWHGAPWRQKANKQPGKQGKGVEGKDGRAGPSPPAFPAYDHKKGGVAKVQPSAHAEHIQVVQTQRNNDSMVKDLQKTLNLARKAEGKVAKLQGEVQERKKMWAEWELQLKQCYMSERKRHAASLEALGRDLQDAVLQQEHARQEVRRVASGQQEQPMELDAWEADVQFNALMAEGAEPELEEDLDEEVLQRALLAATREAPATPKTGQTHPRTPYPSRPGTGQQPSSAACTARGTGSRLQPFPPPKPLASTLYPTADLNSLPSPVAAMDPYQDLQQGPTQKADTPVPVVNRVKPKAAGRMPVKDQARPSGPVGRKVITHSPSKVEELRAAATIEIMGAPMAGQEQTQQQHSHMTAGQLAHLEGSWAVGTGAQKFVIQDDDGPASTSPSFGGLSGGLD